MSGRTSRSPALEVFATQLPPLSQPTMILDRGVMVENFNQLTRLAAGTPLRIASKSIRVRAVLEWALAQPNVVGVLGYSAAEAVWLAECGLTDILVAYPTVDGPSVQTVAADATLRERVTFMVDSIEHIEWMGTQARAAGGSVNVAIDYDCSLRLGPIQIGAHRSPVNSPEAVAALGQTIASTNGVNVVGMMFYEAQVAGVPDVTPIHSFIKKKSMAELLTQRDKAVEVLRQFGDIRIVNGGGSGSVHLTRLDPVITDIAVGSGIFTPTTFDGYAELQTKPAAFFASPVVRHHGEDVVVTFSGGYNASGTMGSSRAPRPVHPHGLKYFGQEGAGEVQTPLRGNAARELKIGDPVWFRHAKAGEAAERFDEALIVENGVVTTTVPTYRGEGKNFG